MTSISDIKNVIIDGQALNINGYLDIGLIDTMEDLFVNFIGAIIFSIFGFFYTKNQDKKEILPLYLFTNKKEIILVKCPKKLITSFFIQIIESQYL